MVNVAHPDWYITIYIPSFPSEELLTLFRLIVYGFDSYPRLNQERGEERIGAY